MALTISELQILVTANTAGAVAAVRRVPQEAANAMQQASGRMQAAGAAMSRAGATMTAGLTVPIIGGIRMVVKAAAEYESAFAGVKKTVNASAPELDRLSDGFRKMSREIPVSAANLAKIGESAGQLGIKTPNILAFTRVIANLGVATNLSGENAAKSLARLANITQMPQTQFQRLASTIVHLGNNLATTESEIVSMALRIAGAGTTIGLTQAQILGFSGALSAVGIRAEMGGSAISKFMMMVATGVNRGGQELANFAKVAGMSSEQFGTLFKTKPTEAIVAVIDGLNRLKKAGGDVFGTLAALGVKDIRMRDVFLRLVKGSDDLVKALGLADAGWRQNTALTEEARRRYETFESQMALFRNRVTDTAIRLGNVLIPVILRLMTAAEPAIRAIERWAVAFTKLSPQTQNVILGFVAFAAAAGPVLVVIGQIATGIGAILPVLGTLWNVFRAGVTVARIVIGAMTPIGWVITGITAAIALAVAAWRGNWFNIQGITRNAVNTIATTFNTLKTAIRLLGPAIVDGLINGIKGKINDAVVAARGLATGVINAAKSALGIASPSRVFQQVGDDVIEGLSRGLADPGQKAKKAIRKTLSEAEKAARAEAASYRSLLSDATARLKEAQTGGDSSEQAIAAKLRNLTAEHRNEIAAIIEKTKRINDARKAREDEAQTLASGIARVQEMIRDTRVDTMKVLNVTPGDQIALEVFNVRYRDLAASTKAWVDQLIQARQQLEATKILAQSPVDIDKIAAGASFGNVRIVGDVRVGGTRPGVRGTTPSADQMSFGTDNVAAAASRQAAQLENLFRRVARGFERDLSQSFETLATRGIKPFFSSLLDSIKQTLLRTFAEMAAQRVLQQILGTGNTAGGAAGGALGGLLGGIGKFLPQVGVGLAVNSLLGNPLKKIGKVLGFADGGIPPVGVPSLVGERGPELFVPSTRGRIIPSEQLSKGIGGNVTINWNQNGPIQHEADERRVADTITRQVRDQLRMAF